MEDIFLSSKQNGAGGTEMLYTHMRIECDSATKEKIWRATVLYQNIREHMFAFIAM